MINTAFRFVCFLSPGLCLVKRVLLSFITLLFMGLMFSTAAGQNSARPDRGFALNGAYDASNLDSVNLQNGNLTTVIPLASLPPIAGGKLSYTLSAYYNSKLWNSQQAEGVGIPFDPGCGIPQAYNTEDAVLSELGGWRIGGQYALFFRSAIEDLAYAVPSYQCDSFENQRMQGLFFKPILRTPDGAEHEMRLVDPYQIYNGNREHLKGYYRDPNTSATNPQGPAITSPLRMYSADGTFLWAVFNPSTDPIRWTIHLKDGTQVIQYRDGTQRIKDQNGNSLQLYGAGAKDEQTGREIRYTTENVNGQIVGRVHYKTVGDVEQTVTINWGETTVSGKLYRDQAWNQDSGTACFYDKQLYPQPLPVIREITFPATESGIANQKFAFSYSSDATVQVTTPNVQWACGAQPTNYTRMASIGFGELSEVTLPSGAKINYSYSLSGTHNFFAAADFATNVVTSKTLTHDGTSETSTYDISSSGGYATSGSVTNSNGTSTVEDFYPTNSLFSQMIGGVDGLGGLVYRTTQSNKIVTERRWSRLLFAGANETAFGTITEKIVFNPVVTAEYTTLLDDAGARQKMSAKTFQYDFNGNLLQTNEYDWFDPSAVTRDARGIPIGIPGGATLLRTTASSYYNQASDAASNNVYAKHTIGLSPKILDAVQETIAGASKTRFSFDGQAYGATPTKGNLTKISRWLDFPAAQWIDTSSEYDSYGNLTKTIDPRGKATSIFYEDATHALPTRVTVDPENGTGVQTSTTTYDFATGAVLSSVDVNGNVTTIDYTNNLLGAVDPFGRPGQVLSPQINVDGTNQRRTTRTYYEDAARRTRVEADLKAQDDALLKAKTTRDQLGRVVLSERTESDGAVISSQNIYLTAQRVTFASNPKRANGAETNGWTRTTADVLGRAIEIASFKGDAQPPTTGTNANWLGSVLTSYDANTKTVTDQAGKKRTGISDGLGRTTRVIEDPTGQNLTTDYYFDSLSNLRKTVQGAQKRYFLYDSFGRVTRARQPEQGTHASLNQTSDALTDNNNQWSVGYTYDQSGNTLTTTDARGVTVTGTYDALNRLKTRDYSDTAALPDVTFTYENAGIAFSKGKLTAVSSNVSTTRYTEFDRLGGVLQSRQETGGQSYNFAYTYNLSGTLTTQKYPSGRTVRNIIDNDGDLAAIASRASSVAPLRNYASDFKYNAVGATEAMRLGNNRWETARFNARGQVTQIGLGTSATDTGLLKLEYGYGTATQNNGAMREQKISFTGLAAPIVQTYTYDALNRLQSSAERAQGGSADSWKQTFAFDRFGNRTFDEANTTTLQKTCAVTAQNPRGVCSREQVNPQINQANNRFADGQGYEYDAAGHLTKDATGKLFAYNAEGRQQSFGTNGSNTNGGSYQYDGQGKRVKKTVGTVETIFVYDAFGKLTAEYETNTTRPPKSIKFLTTDHLGSPRIATDSTGAIVSRHDYRAYGDEIMAGVGARTTTQKYSAVDNIRQQFTGYERDTESGLDYAQARYYNSAHGRFTSVDPLTASATIKNPQTFNRYSYALNSPYKFTDPLGLVAIARAAGTTAGNQHCAFDGCEFLAEERGGSSGAPQQDQQSQSGEVVEGGQVGTVNIPMPADEPIQEESTTLTRWHWFIEWVEYIPKARGFPYKNMRVDYPNAFDDLLYEFSKSEAQTAYEDEEAYADWYFGGGTSIAAPFEIGKGNPPTARYFKNDKGLNQKLENIIDMGNYTSDQKVKLKSHVNNIIDKTGDEARKIGANKFFADNPRMKASINWGYRLQRNTQRKYKDGVN